MKGATKEAKAKKAPKKDAKVVVLEPGPVATAAPPAAGDNNRIVVPGIPFDVMSERATAALEKNVRDETGAANTYRETIERARAELAEQQRIHEEMTRQSIAAAGQDLMSTFEKGWNKFKDYVALNAHHLNNPEQAELLTRAVQKPAELALITLAMKLPEHAHMIVTRDGLAARRFAMSLVDISKMVLPPPVEEKFFDFFVFFLGILESIQQQK